jgi:hypothetical protein
VAFTTNRTPSCGVPVWDRAVALIVAADALERAAVGTGRSIMLARAAMPSLSRRAYRRYATKVHGTPTP